MNTYVFKQMFTEHQFTQVLNGDNTKVESIPFYKELAR